MKALIPSEHQEQVDLVKWAELMKRQIPALSLLHAIPNGGDRHPAVGRKLKDEGVKAGFPDLNLPVARRGYYGLFIEMKNRIGGRLSSDQKWWKEALQREGYRVEICHGFEAAKAVIEEYLG
jgi:hypothetical protein